jgi:hypothetical protein
MMNSARRKLEVSGIFIFVAPLARKVESRADAIHPSDTERD